MSSTSQTTSPEALSQVLLGLGIFPFIVKREVGETREVVIAKTNNWSLLGTLSEFAFMIRFRLEDNPDANLTDIALWLSDTIVGPLGLEIPGETTKRLLAKMPNI